MGYQGANRPTNCQLTNCWLLSRKRETTVTYRHGDGWAWDTDTAPCAGCWILIIVDNEDGNCHHNWVVRIQTSYCRQEQWGHTTTIQQWRLDSGWLPNFIVWIINQAPWCVVGNIFRHLKDESIGFSHSFDSGETYPQQQNAETVCQSLEIPSPSVRRR